MVDCVWWFVAYIPLTEKHGIEECRTHAQGLFANSFLLRVGKATQSRERAAGRRTWKVQSRTKIKEGVEAGGDAERGEHGGARRQAVARQRGRSKTVPSRRIQSTSTGGARRMTQVLKPYLRQERQGRLRKASDGVEEERKARKDRAPRKMTEGTLKILNIRKGPNTKKLREGCRIPWQTQADAEKLFGLLKMQSMLEAQKAVGTPGHC
eukprot:gene17808-biopygen5145